jgi:hypothetical protein
MDHEQLALRNVTFMTTDPGRLAEFWSEALHYGERHEGPSEVIIAKEDWGFPRLTFQAVSAAPAQQLHVDLTAGSRQAEVERLVGLGATIVRTHDSGQQAPSWTVMQDPDGNEFCVAEIPGATA